MIKMNIYIHFKKYFNTLCAFSGYCFPFKNGCTFAANRTDFYS